MPEIITFRTMTVWERIKRFSPSYRARRDAEMRAAIRRLLVDPSLPCKIGHIVVPNGYGVAWAELCHHEGLI